MTYSKAIPLLQPLTTTLKPIEVCGLLRHDRHPFFLDSGGDCRRLGRYSFLGSDPFLIFRHRRGRNEIISGNSIEVMSGNPFDILKVIFSKYRLITPPGLPPFVGGAIGYFAYDLKHFIEKLPPPPAGDDDIPLCFFAFYDTVIIFDHLKNRTYISATGLPEETEHYKRLRAQSRFEELQRKLNAGSAPIQSEILEENRPAAQEVTCNFRREDYLKAILKAKEYIAAGDIYQVNLSQKFSARVYTSAFHLYKTVRRLNPAPFASFFDCGDAVIISTSPERFLRISNRWVETRPIKGTRPRGSNRAEDDRLKAELLTSAKDRAELIMIVDLERNDLGRVCDYGSVSVPVLFTLEQYATVFHLVSTVTGRLKQGNDHLDCIRAAFPGGSITGAPKIRAMEIIDELEPRPRGIYTGSLGYLGFNRQTDLNILIRTMLYRNGTIHFQVGGGIVADSDPAMEYEETLHKGKALLAALQCGNGVPFTCAGSD
jgi:para-aminobenzoate synthetase component 1